jgi:hypothetical protein
VTWITHARGPEYLQIAQEKARANAEHQQQEQAFEAVDHRLKMHAVSSNFCFYSQIKLAAEAKHREQALDPSVEIQVKQGICCCFGFEVEKEQARLALEEQALSISSFGYIEMSKAFEAQKGLL